VRVSRIGDDFYRLAHGGCSYSAANCLTDSDSLCGGRHNAMHAPSMIDKIEILKHSSFRNRDSHQSEARSEGILKITVSSPVGLATSRSWHTGTSTFLDLVHAGVRGGRLPARSFATRHFRTFLAIASCRVG